MISSFLIFQNRFFFKLLLYKEMLTFFYSVYIHALIIFTLKITLSRSITVPAQKKRSNIDKIWNLIFYFCEKTHSNKEDVNPNICLRKSYRFWSSCVHLCQGCVYPDLVITGFRISMLQKPQDRLSSLAD